MTLMRKLDPADPICRHCGVTSALAVIGALLAACVGGAPIDANRRGETRGDPREMARPSVDDEGKSPSADWPASGLINPDTVLPADNGESASPPTAQLPSDQPDPDTTLPADSDESTSPSATQPPSDPSDRETELPPNPNQGQEPTDDSPGGDEGGAEERLVVAEPAANEERSVADPANGAPEATGEIMGADELGTNTPLDANAAEGIAAERRARRCPESQNAAQDRDAETEASFGAEANARQADYLKSDGVQLALLKNPLDGFFGAVSVAADAELASARYWYGPTDGEVVWLFQFGFIPPPRDILKTPALSWYGFRLAGQVGKAGVRASDVTTNPISGGGREVYLDYYRAAHDAWSYAIVELGRPGAAQPVWYFLEGRERIPFKPEVKDAFHTIVLGISVDGERLGVVRTSLEPLDPSRELLLEQGEFLPDGTEYGVGIEVRDRACGVDRAIEWSPLL